jgi:hypothetical protein
MQKVAILLRKASAPNRFRRIILNALADPLLTDCMVASGFFQENAPILVSPDFVAHLAGIAAGKTVTFVGIHSWSWRAQYDQFVNNVAAGCPGLTLHRRRIPGDKWHAKIFIASKASSPVLGIIGSSNITGRAFQELEKWNYEADVVFWYDSDPAVSDLVRRNLVGEGAKDDGTDVVITTYDPNDPLNRGQPLGVRLQQILSEINQRTVPF